MILRMELEDYVGKKITFEQLSRRARRILAERTNERIMEILNEGAIEIRNRIIEGMRDSPPTGRLYFRRRAIKSGKNKGKSKVIFHRASSPGNYPRVDYGALVRSIGIDARPDEVEVGSRITKPAYPKYLEDGTKKKKMKARPWLRPSYNKEIPKIKRRLAMVLRRSAGDFLRGL